MRSIDEIETYLKGALQADVRGKLVARGEARAIIRREGNFSPDAPQFAITIEADLADYGFAILDAALELREHDNQHQLLQEAFRVAGSVIESLVRNGNITRKDRGFYRTIAAAAYHLASYAAVAYALFPSFNDTDYNLSPAEECLVRLILRDLDGVRKISKNWLTNPSFSDETLSNTLTEIEGTQGEIFGTAIITGMMRGLAYFEFALLTGENALVVMASRQLDAAYGLAGETGHVLLWWLLRLTKSLITDLWFASLHQVLPLAPTAGDPADYEKNREIFIASLFAKSTSQIELWPSQISAALRTADPKDNLVVALPTSAGKTRIAELAALTCLSQGKRVLIITPLRALSAQTERSFRSTFSPLDFEVSSLYGASGLSSGDSNALKTDQIVVATPEKFDFALRSNPGIIDDIGLIVLDEGHLIGPSEREVRYEILVQRLLLRQDSTQRRIVCLSAILPAGDELEDMTSWLRSDAPGNPVRSEWRPTKQRFGTLEWRKNRASLRYDLEDDGPYISQYLTEMPARGGDRRPRPRNIQEITLMGAWGFASEGKRTLIFVTQANWVEGFAKHALQLVRKGYLEPLPVDQLAIQNAITIGEDWLGVNHPAVVCLKIGMAIHHGGLPSPFLREIERLLASGAIQVTAASPTLAQGLNLNAAVLLTPYIVRSGSTISGEEFANVAGRAGRAYVDTEGLILHVMNDKYNYRRSEWKKLVQSARARSLQSGISQIINLVIKKLIKRGVNSNEVGYEFLANSRSDWLIEPDGDDGLPISDLVTRLDTVIFGLIEALDSDQEKLPELLDEALSGSLWDRKMARLEPGERRLQQIVLRTRARLIWSSSTSLQRKGHFAMGVGLDTGLQLDELSPDLEGHLDRADLAALQGDVEMLLLSLEALAQHLLTMKPFIPDSGDAFPVGWKGVLRQWLSGAPIAEIDGNNTKFIEDVFVYRLVWAIEAIRIRRIAHGWTGGELLISGMAASCLDTGLPSFRMAMMVRAGLPSRNAAKKVVRECDPPFFERSELRAWLETPEIEALSALDNWPSSETVMLWRRFREDMIQQTNRPWSKQIHPITLENSDNIQELFRIDTTDLQNPKALTADFSEIGTITSQMPIQAKGLRYGIRTQDDNFRLICIGPN